MKKEDLTILVVGAGAVGGITAALLKKHGYNVEIICKHDAYAEKINRNGFSVSGVTGNFVIVVPAFASAEKISGKKDLILLATKVTDMADAARSVIHLLSEEGCLVAFQNGIFEEELASISGNVSVAGCITGWGATMEEHGNLNMTSSGDFILGYPDKAADKKLEDIALILSSVMPAGITDNFIGHQYSKLIINSCITALGAVCGLYLGKMLSRRKIRNIFIEIMREAILVADALNIKVEVFGGRLDFYKFLGGTGPLSVIKRHFMIMIIGFKYRKLKSSSLQSLSKGKPTEIEYLNGFIVRMGYAKGIPVPVNGTIVRMIHEIENKSRIISESNFIDPFFDRFS